MLITYACFVNKNTSKYLDKTLIFNWLAVLTNTKLAMNTKVDLKSNELVSIFHEKTEWNLARVKFLVYFICALFKVQTVCFTTIAEALNGDAQVESNLRRIQRFFAEFVIEMDLFAKIVFSLLPIQAPFRLSMDRTNWKFGGLDINILMISVCYLGVAIPLIWMMLPKKGNSNQKERKALIEHYIRLFGTQSIGSILADREFIGDDWIGDLIGKRVHFYFRIKENMKVKINGKEPQKALWLFNNLPKNTAMSLRKIVKVGTQYVYLSGMKTIDKDGKLTFVIIATYNFDPEALTVYKDRWQIETMFYAKFMIMQSNPLKDAA